ncbi:MAG: NfeD family protein [Myxococcota bacterium]
MNIRRSLCVFLFVFGAVSHLVHAQEQSKDTPEPAKLDAYDAEAGAGKRVLEIPIEGTIELGIAAFIERAVAEARENDVLIFRVKTFGGRVDAAVRIRDAILNVKNPTVAFIEQRAISAGALISLAADDIIMTAGASIGAATPVTGGGPNEGEMTAAGEKVISYMRAEMRSTAEANGRRGDIAEAMVDPDVEVEGVIEKGKTLTLTTERAVELGIAERSVERYEDVFEVLNLPEATRSTYVESWSEKLARVLTDPTVSSLLMTFGFLGLLLELYSPGFGVGGLIGVTCLFLFFVGQYTAHLAGWEEAMLIVGGIVLIALEVFVIPGFGVAGISGLLLLLAGLLFAMIELNLPLDVAFELGYVRGQIESAVIRIAVALVALIVGAFAFAKFLPGTFVGRRIILADATGSADGYVAGIDASKHDLLGAKGVANSTLRPSGIGLFDGKRVDVVAEGTYIEKGRSIEVVKVDFNRVVVAEVSADSEATA